MTKINIEREEFMRVGTTLCKLVNQPRLDGGYVKKRISWNAETLREDYAKGFMASVPKYDGFCTSRLERTGLYGSQLRFQS